MQRLRLAVLLLCHCLLGAALPLLGLVPHVFSISHLLPHFVPHFFTIVALAVALLLPFLQHTNAVSSDSSSAGSRG